MTTRADSAAALPGGVVHELPDAVRAALEASPAAAAVWRDITPLARNEFLCWMADAKQQRTRDRRLAVGIDKLEHGERRPCCWPGCHHRERTGRA